MKILIASDLSARSDRAIARGFALAKALKGQLRILHIVDQDLPEEFKAHSIEWAKGALKRETERLSADTGVNADFEVYAGHPKTEILRQADPSRTELILLGIHDRLKRGSHSFANTTAGQILKFSLPAVLLVRDDVSEPYRQVVVGVDFSIFTRAAIQQASHIAPAASFNLVHAYHVPFKGFISSEGFANEIAYEERLKIDSFLNEEMQSLDKRVRAMGLFPGGLNTVLKEGAPSEVLRRECAGLGADLLIIAAHGRPGASRAIWGSVAVDFLDNPPCDVLVIRPY